MVEHKGKGTFSVGLVLSGKDSHGQRIQPQFIRRSQ
jgi:hypothetical protein